MHDLSLYLLDVIENSVRAGATTISVRISADRAADTLMIAVEDDGPGLTVAPREALDPFFTTKRGKRTGLGLSLFRQAAEAAGGGLCIVRSPELGGLAVRARLSLGHVDRPPLGDIAATLTTMALANPGIEFIADLRDGPRRVEVRGAELQQQLADLVAYQEALS
jgi:hypothetical protein